MQVEVMASQNSVVFGDTVYNAPIHCHSSNSANRISTEQQRSIDMTICWAYILTFLSTLAIHCPKKYIVIIRLSILTKRITEQLMPSGNVVHKYIL